MLGPHFNEGQNLSCENPKRIPLPEDNPSAMKLLCAILHHRYEPEETPSFKLIQALAEAVDKYLCVSSTTAITTMWLHVILVRASVWDFAQLVELLAASYLLKSDSAFHETSKHLVLKYSSTLALDFDHAMTRLPWKSIVAIGELKNMFETEIYDRVIAIVIPFMDKHRQRVSKNCTAENPTLCCHPMMNVLAKPRSKFIPARGHSLERHFEYLYGDRLQEDGEPGETPIETALSANLSAQQMCEECRWEVIDVLSEYLEKLEERLRPDIDERSGLCLGCTVENDKMINTCYKGKHFWSSKKQRTS
ncbi:hypothetical protein BC567DRAFT_218369 [Phyllosticta citribraziliensis]